MKWQQALKDYKLFLKIERGLSKNSIDNYILDVTKLIKYLESNNINSSPISIDSDIVQQFIYEVANECLNVCGETFFFKPIFSTNCLIIVNIMALVSCLPRLFKNKVSSNPAWIFM